MNMAALAVLQTLHFFQSIYNVTLFVLPLARRWDVHTATFLYFVLEEIT